jgi:DnaJ-class molecular chaperone
LKHHSEAIETDLDNEKKEMREGGLKEVAGGGDLYVTYHVTTKERTTNFGYGGYWGG